MAAKITEASLRSFVLQLGDKHPPIGLGSVDRTVRDPEAVRTRFAHVIDYLARVELEVDRNVLELLTLLPNVSEVDRIFYQDVWYDQEMAHGYLLDQLQGDLGMEPQPPFMTIPLRMKLLGALAHWEPIHDISRMLYYLTGASTERQAVLAYSSLIKELTRMGESAIVETIIHPIKQQEPGHFAFYRMSAEKMVQDAELKPWQVQVTRLLRSKSFTMVGVDYVRRAWTFRPTSSRRCASRSRCTGATRASTPRAPPSSCSEADSPDPDGWGKLAGLPGEGPPGVRDRLANPRWAPARADIQA